MGSRRVCVPLGGTGSPFAVSGAPIDQDAVVGEVGLAYRASDLVSLSLGYTAQAGRHAADQSVKGQFELRF